MAERKWHQIWIEQCDAAEGIKQRCGTKAAFDYLVGEKLPGFAEAAAQHPEFARELPRFVSRVRQMFDVREIQRHLQRIEHERFDAAVAAAQITVDEEDVSTEDPKTTAERDRRFAAVKELLTAPFLGTS